MSFSSDGASEKNIPSHAKNSDRLTGATLLDQYEVIEQVDHSGMGAIYIVDSSCT